MYLVLGSRSSFLVLDTSSECSSYEPTKTRKPNLPPNALFMPAGACHTLKFPKSKTKKPSKIDARELYGGSDSDAFITSTPKQTSAKQLQNQQNTSDVSDDTSSRRSSSSSNAPVLPLNQPGQMVIKPHCSCSKCSYWNESKEWINSTECSERKVNKPVCNYKHSLFKKEDENQVHKVLSLDYSSSTKLEKKAKQKLLLHR